MIKWTKEYDDFLKENAAGLYIDELTNKFNEKFKLNATVAAVTQRKKKFKIKSGTRGFKKGHDTPHKKTIGSERLVNGRVHIKISDPDVWKEKSHIVYEQYNKIKIPVGHRVIFLNGNCFDFSPDNLKLVSRDELLIMNNHKLRFNDKELTETGVLIAKIINKRGVLENERL